MSPQIRVGRRLCGRLTALIPVPGTDGYELVTVGSGTHDYFELEEQFSGRRHNTPAFGGKRGRDLAALVELTQRLRVAQRALVHVLDASLFERFTKGGFAEAAAAREG